MNHLLTSGRISFKMLRYFEAAASYEHLGRAAESLNISKSALSGQIKDLEQALEFPLFNRHNNRITLTEAGRLMKVEAGQMLEQMSQALDRVIQAGKSEQQTLNIGIVSSALWHRLFELLGQFRKQYPTLLINFVELAPNEQRKALIDRSIDIGFSRSGDVHKMLPFQAKIAFKDFLCAAVPANHVLANESELSLSQLKDLDMVQFDHHRSGTAELINQKCLKQGFRPRVRYKAVEPQTMMAFVSAGQAISIVPQCFSSQPWKQVVFIPLKEKIPADLCVVYDQQKQGGVLASLVKLIDDLQAKPEVAS